MPNVLVVAESRAGEVRKVALELLSAARSLAAGGEVHAVLAGAPGIAGQAPSLAAHGADAIFVTEHAALDPYNAEALAALVAERARAGSYPVVLLPASAQGKDLAPRVAARLGVPIASDALSVRAEGDAVVVTHYVYAGKIVATLRLAATPAVVSMRPGAVAPAAAPGAGRVESAAAVGDPAASRVVVTETIRGDARKLDLTEAPVIVSGGRGLKAAEHFRLVEELAAAFGNAAVGATRAVTDEGWRPHSDQIGQTGRQVSPDLYVAVGISGAIQHLAGMRTSRTIVAINKDRDAPIFKVADYGIVGDVFEVVPALTAAIREARSKG
ncbi:electron transfer flavoprotein subunit alpha/FixB family protein [Candidatus Uhrbacteria bacterium]|nr:MAG: electron transfer flavoprotein subunit alpha/FixB family protein [Candidatus Uhrbacteria bacterium]